jgi:hypothetical protein
MTFLVKIVIFFKFSDFLLCILPDTLQRKLFPNFDFISLKDMLCLRQSANVDTFK